MASVCVRRKKVHLPRHIVPEEGFIVRGDGREPAVFSNDLNRGKGFKLFNRLLDVVLESVFVIDRVDIAGEMLERLDGVMNKIVYFGGEGADKELAFLVYSRTDIVDRASICRLCLK